MVYIKKLTIQGFKSFGPKRISIELERGFIAITGPNGGGKSNILDAIRFALGELSAHNLRVSRMAELVHDDPSTSWAKTSITLDNSEKVIPIDSEEVTISRKMMRSGESEYYVNGRQVSRNDLLTLLSMANIKSTGFNIIPQGSVIEIAEMSGSELRKMLEDVAGISDYEKKKVEAEEQLAIAEKNLAIAKASTKEVKIRVKQLEKERNQLFRKKQVESFLNAIKQLRLKKGIASIERELEEIDEQLLHVEKRIVELQGEKEKLLSDKNCVNASIGKISKELEEVESELSRIQSEKAIMESRINALEVNSSVLEERSARMLREKEYLSERIRNLIENLEILKARIMNCERERVALINELEERRRRTQDLLDELNKVEMRYSELKDVVEREEARKKEKIKWEIELKEARARREEISDVISEVSSEIAELSKTSYEKASAAFSTRLQIREKDKRMNEILEELSGLKTSMNHLAHRLSGVEDVSRRLSMILEKIASSGIIKEMDENVELLQAMRASGIEGVRGFLKDFIIADETGYKLLKSVIGEWIDALVVDRLDLGMELAKLFEECGIGAKIVSMDIAATFTNRAKLPGITFKEKWAEMVLGYLLKDVDFSGKTGALGRKKLVTRHIIMYPDFRIETINPDRIALDDILNKEYRESIKILEKLKDLALNVNAEIDQLRQKISKKEEELEELNSEIRSLTQWSLTLHLQSSETILKEIKEILRLKQLGEEMAKIAEKIKFTEENIKNISEPERELGEELKKFEQELMEKRRSYEESRVEYAKLEVEVKALQRELESLRGERERILEERHRLEQRMAQIDEERGRTLQSYERIKDEIKDLKKQLEEKRSKLEKLINVKSEMRMEMNKLSDEMSLLNSKIDQIENELQKLSPIKISLQVRRAQLEVQLRNLREKMESVNTTNIDFPEINEEEASRLEEDLEEELKELEMVNQLAPAQYEEIIGNYKLRSSRIMELEAERMEIIRFIEWIEGEKKRIFVETFDRVANAFENYFNRLTGGSGWLKLENPDNPFEGGVEMILAFPGKQPRSVRSASGGEKSVAAVSLLLALQGLTPADFYVFDEVDAHMDLQYTRRLAELFEEMAKKTQIIVISLKDVLVEKADQVIGVYNIGGASKIVKTKLEEVVRNGR